MDSGGDVTAQCHRHAADSARQRAAEQARPAQQLHLHAFIQPKFAQTARFGFGESVPIHAGDGAEGIGAQLHEAYGP
ncbi:hypothetical protein ATB93_08340 [Sphingomonas sp. WG]|nr:hypothetical protein ATB93_08340 [Sphingomonas sp. WG]